ncbi:MAG: Co2+/Mg2+ efflux protein ApaG [Deltaproteobacteria bacterium]|nr:MAG: Co2+/Mg2+ efflux protein ApaG [Deltaproteobacteria bacterium]
MEDDGRREARACTEGIEVIVRAAFSAEHSRTERSLWFYIYEITIRNTGDAPAQLVDRHWVITDAQGHVEEVRGPGVVGETPLLAPGQSFRYASGCPLRTPFGTMRGTYGMERPDGSRFDAVVPEFMLAQPHALN